MAIYTLDNSNQLMKATTLRCGLLLSLDIQIIVHRCACSSRSAWPLQHAEGIFMIRKLKSGKYRLYSRKKDPKSGKRKNLGTFNSKAAAKKHERAVQYFKRH